MYVNTFTAMLRKYNICSAHREMSSHILPKIHELLKYELT